MAEEKVYTKTFMEHISYKELSRLQKLFVTEKKRYAVLLESVEKELCRRKAKFTTSSDRQERTDPDGDKEDLSLYRGK